MTALTGVLVGRGSELSHLEGFLRRASATGEALVMAGGPGLGKTSMLRYASSLAEQRGTVVLQGSGTEGELETGFATLHELLHPHRDRLASLSARHREALEVCLGLAEGPAALRASVGAATLALVDLLGSQRPVLVAVDDVHWVDRPSAEVLGVLAHHLVGRRVGFLTTLREGAQSYFEHDSLPHLWLGPLTTAQSRFLLDRRGPRLANAVRDQVLAEAAGNPLALLELPLEPGAGEPSAAAPVLSP